MIFHTSLKTQNTRWYFVLQAKFDQDADTWNDIEFLALPIFKQMVAGITWIYNAFELGIDSLCSQTELIECFTGIYFFFLKVAFFFSIFVPVGRIISRLDLKILQLDKLCDTSLFSFVIFQ